MPLVRLIVPLGLVVLGAVAAYMGLVVLATSLGTGEISIGSGKAGETVVRTTRRAEDAGGYWLRVAGLGLAPAALGIACAIFGWRRLGR
jgi:hypothetical protein